MKKLLAILLCLAMLFTLAACGAKEETAAEPVAEEAAAEPTAEKQSYVITLGHPEAEDDEHGIHQLIAVEFRDRIAEYTDGRIQVEIYGNSQLGAERDLLEGMQLGTIDMASTANLIVGNFDSAYGVFDLPYMFTSPAEAYKVLDSDYIAELNEKFAEESGIRILAYGSGGFRQVVSTKPVDSMDDLKNLKIRVPENDVYRETFAALGANPTVMAWTELYTGLSQGTVDAFEIVSPVIYTSHFYEVCDYVGVTNHFFSPDPFMISEQLWDQFDAEDQALIVKAAKEAAEVERAMVEDYQAEIFDALRAEGMTVNEDIDLTPFKEATKGVIDIVKDKVGADVIENVQAILAQ